MGPMGNAYTLNWPFATSSWLAGELLSALLAAYAFVDFWGSGFASFGLIRSRGFVILYRV